jgi:hypothetical protein
VSTPFFKGTLKLALMGYANDLRRGLLTGASVFIMCNYLFPLANKLNFPRGKRWIVEHIPSQWVQDMKDIVDVMEQTAVDICKAKKEEIMSGESDESKKDIISILSWFFPLISDFTSG